MISNIGLPGLILVLFITSQAALCTTAVVI